jgi:hypothetical protein
MCRATFTGQRSEDTVTIYIGEDGKDVGRQSVIRPESTNPSFSIYCYRHGCQIVKKPDQWPSTAQLQQWLIRGLGLPAGAGHKVAHKKLWPLV